MAWRYLYYRQTIQKLHPRFYSCPTECAYDQAKPFDIYRSKFCDGCDKKTLEERLREKVIEHWRKRLGDKSEKFHFDHVFSTLKSVIGFENLPVEKLSVKTSYLLNVYLDEKNKYEFIKSYEREKENDK
ncbi:MAG TPA: hypothetical protein VF556_17740 [Pyrinomonadaceae bacterium]|jgi:hypothetical protein